MSGHTHVIPVDMSMTADEAWKELCIFGRRVAFTGSEKWAVIQCDGDECRHIASIPERPRPMPFRHRRR